MNYLSLFSGVEGGGLAFQHLIKPKITCIGYVENDDYCQRVIKQRQVDGLLDKAPIYGDIRTFINSGCAELYKGITDVIAGGFPCQPFSVAGKRLEGKDNRNMWPETIETIRIVKPVTVFLENVPGLLASEYALTIFRQLRENGYQALPPLKLGADDIGANHRRKRAWIVAKSIGARTWDNTGTIGADRGRGARRDESTLRQTYGQNGTNRTDATGCIEGNVAHANNSRNRTPGDRIDQNGQAKNKRREKQSFIRIGGQGQDVSNTNINGRNQRRQRFAKTGGNGVVGNNWWSTEPALGRVAHGVANRVDRLKAIGNGQVPQVAAFAWEILKTT